MKNMEIEYLPTGVEALDKLLQGGYETDSVITVYGPAGSGKTNLALLAALEVIKKGKRVIYIDTEGGFSITRLKQLIDEPKKIMDKIIFIKPMQFEEQKKAFEELKTIVHSKIGLIIIDTISMLYRMERKMNDDSGVSDFNRELGLQVGLLSEIARKHGIPSFVTSQVYTSFENGRLNLVGGDILKYGSKCLIELQVLNNGKRKMILKKHRSIAAEKELIYEIVEKGIEAY